MPTDCIAIAAICIGKPALIREDGTQSAIFKSPVRGIIHIEYLGIDGDVQADPTVHGGPDKAIHLYSHDHYPHWRDILNGHPALDTPGAFGENLCIQGVAEEDLWLGDRFRLGTALLEISMGRQPCWKLDARFGQKGVMAHMVKTGFCGAYLRVLEPGLATQNDNLVREERGEPDWSVQRLFHTLVSGQMATTEQEIDYLAQHPALGKSWRERARKRMQSMI